MSKPFSNNKLFVLFCALTFSLAAAVDARAENASKLKKIEGPITITSGTLTADNLSQTALFEHNVVARTPNTTMYADRMLVYYDRGTGNVVKIDMSGAVRFVTAKFLITSREAMYISGEEKIVFTGAPRIVEGENVVTGSKMIYLMNEDRFFVEGSKVFLPNRKEQ